MMTNKIFLTLIALLLACPVLAQNKTIDVYSNGAKIHSVETDAGTVWMRGDGWKDLGTFSTSGGTTPPPTGAGVSKIVPGANITISPSTGTGEVTINGAAPIPGPAGAQGPAGPTGATGGVNKLIAGSGVTLSPPGGQGDVTVSAAGSGGGSGGFPIVTTQAQFVAAVNDAFANCYVVNFGNGSRFVVTGRMNFTVKDCGQDPVGWNGHGLRITNESGGVNDGGGVIEIQTQGAVSRSLFIAGTAIYGGGYQGANSGDCLRITALRNNAIYKLTARDLWMDYCGNGLALVGDVFEASIYNHHGENNNGSGIYMNHGADCGIISNIFLFGPNESRNKRYGIELDTRAGCGGVSSVHMYAPTMVSNAIGGIRATGGVRSIWGGNCENSGLVCVDVGNSPYQTVIMGMEMSTDNSTNAGVNGSQAAKYLLRFPTAENARLYFPTGANSVACYGSNCTGVQLRAP